MMQHEFPLRLVTAIAKAGSIRAAAEDMAITPSALNRRLQSLETELGTKVFERIANGVILNPAGEIFIAHAQRQLADFEAVKSRIEDLKGARRGQITIAYDDALKRNGAFPQQIHSYQKRHPGVVFEIKTTFADQIAAELMDYQADLAVQLGPRTNPHLTSLAAAKAQVNVVMQPGLIATRSNAVRFDQLADHPWVLPARGSLRNILQQVAARKQLTVQTMIGAELCFARPALLSGDAIGFAVDICDAPHPDDGLARIPLAPRDIPQLFLHLLQLKGRNLSVAASQFAEAVQTRYLRFNDAA